MCAGLKRLVLVVFTASSMFFAVGNAWAQDAGGDEAGEAGVTSYDFEDDLVTGDLVRPDGENLIVRKKGRRSSLIQIREHFIPEILQSVEDL